MKEARKLLIRMGTKKLGQLNRRAQTALHKVTALARLEELFERLDTADSWPELLAESRTNQP